MSVFVFLIALAVFICDPGRAAADPITAAVATFLSVSTATATFIVQVAFSLVTTALSAALAKKPGGQRAPGIKTDTTTTGGSNPQTFILGRYATSGNMLAPPYSHPNSGAVPNKYLTYVVDLSDLPGVEFARMVQAGEYIEDFEASDTTHDLEGLFVDGVPHAFLTWHNGHNTAADPYMMENYADHPDRPWSADMVGAGVAYAVVTFVYNRKLFNALPGVRFEVLGIPLYDPRKDSTVGGSGSHRWGDPTTWEFTENNVVMIYNILRGITLPDGATWGGQVPADDLPLDNWFSGMNECDLAMSLKGGGSEPQFVAGYEVGLDDQPVSVIDELAKGCSAQIAETGGVYRIRVGGPGLPVMFITDDDIVIDEPETLQPYPGLDGVHNAIHATHPAPAALWESKDAPPLYNAKWEAEDNGRRLVAEVSLPVVASDTQVQRLMSAWIKDERRFRRHSLTLPPEAAILDPLDTIAWTSARHGYTSKVFEIGEVSDNLTTMLQSLSMRERDAGDVTWVPSTDEKTVNHPSTKVTRPANRVVPGFNAQAVTLSGQNGARIGLRLFWDKDAMGSSEALEFEVELLADQSDVASGVVSDTSKGRKTIRGGLLSSTFYRARARVVGRATGDWADWITVQTPDLRLGLNDLSDEAQAAIATGDEGGLTQADLDALRGGFQGTMADLEVDAAAAQQAALDSDAAKVAAQAARDEAENAAVSADGAATSAAGSANAALASADEAGTSASAASADRVAAQTARGGAEAARDLAATSKDGADSAEAAAVEAKDLAVTAKGGADAARAAAELAETNAAQAKSDAEGASSTAVSARDLAVTAGFDAEQAAMRLFPNDFAEDGRYWHGNSAGVPGSYPVAGWQFKDVAGEGRVAYVPISSGLQWLLTAGVFRPVIGRTYRLTVRMRNAGTVGGSPQSALFFRSLEEDYGNAQAQSFTSFNQTGSYADYVIEWTVTEAHAWARAGMYSRETATGTGEIRVQSITVEDVTKEKEATDAAAAAAISESAAVSAKNSAEAASAAASFSRDVAAKVANGGGCLNPIFAEWPGDYTQVTDGAGGGWVGQSVGTGKYGNSWMYYTGTSVNTSYPYLIRNATVADNAVFASQADFVEIDMEVEMVSGQWGSARVVVQWHGDNYYSEIVYLSDHLSNNNGKIQRLTAILERPSNYTTGSGPNELRIVFYGNTASSPHSNVAHTARVHRFDYRVLNSAAQAIIQQQAIADLEGNAASSLIFRTRANGASGELELASLSNPNGSVSIAKLSADRFQFIGSFADFFGTVSIDGELIVNGAVSKKAFFDLSSGSTITGVGSGNADNVFGHSVPIDFGEYDASVLPSNPMQMTIAGTATPATNAPHWLRIRVQGRVGGNWQDLSLRLAADIYLYDGRTQSFTAMAMDDAVGTNPSDCDRFRIMGYLINSGIYTGSSVTLDSRTFCQLEQINK